MKQRHLTLPNVLAYVSAAGRSVAPERLTIPAYADWRAAQTLTGVWAPTVPQILHHTGSWAQAIEAAGLPWPPREAWLDLD